MQPDVGGKCHVLKVIDLSPCVPLRFGHRDLFPSELDVQQMLSRNCKPEAS